MTLPFILKAEPLKIAASQNFEPYVIQTDNSLDGIDIEIGNELYRRMGLRHEYKVMPWARQLQYAEKGLVQGILTVYCDDQRDFLEITEEHFYEVKISLFTNSEKNTVKNISKIADIPENASIGIVRDNYFIDLLDDKTNIDKVLSHSTSILIPQLAFGRIDYVLEEYAPFRYYAKKSGNVSKVVEVIEAQKNKVCSAFSRVHYGNAESMELAELASKHIKQMRQEGFVKRIVDNYLY